MPSFQYQVRDKSGGTSVGVIEAESDRAAVAKLRDQGMYVLAIRPKADSKIGGAVRTGVSPGAVNPHRRVGLKDLTIMCRQFAVMVNSGLPLLTCLTILQKQVSNKVLQAVIQEISRDVQGGSTLSAAARRFPKAFPNLFVSMVEAGELGGILDQVLEKVAVNFEKELDLREKIIGAMIYPMVILGVAAGVIAGLFIFVLPIFKKIFSEQGIQLPPLTQLLLGISTLFTDYWWAMILGITGLAIGYSSYRKTSGGRRNIDMIALKIPLFGDLVMKTSVARFCRIFSTLFSSGVPLLQSLEVLKGLLDNRILADAIVNVQEGVKKGTGMARPLMEMNLFPVMVSQMMAIGEETGNVETVMEKVADFYEKEVEHAVKNLTSMMEPMIVVLLGGVVGMIVAAIMLPMMQMTQAMGT